MPKHRADCTDCPWSYRDEDLVDVSDEMERHARKEHHHVDLQRAVATDGGEDLPKLIDWPYDAVVHGADVDRDCLALTSSGKPCSYNAYASNDDPVCNTHADVDDPELVIGAHQWARITDGDTTIAVCVNCEQVWRSGTPATAVDCPECGVDAGKRCKDETSRHAAPIPPHPQRRRHAMSTVDDYERCPAGPGRDVDDDQEQLVTDGGVEQAETGVTHEHRIEPGDVVYDLGQQGQPKLQVRRVLAESVAEYERQEDFDLSSYKHHSRLPVSRSDRVLECVYLPDDPGAAPSDGNPYPVPSGRLARSPVELADEGHRIQDELRLDVLETMFRRAKSLDEDPGDSAGTLVEAVRLVAGDDCVELLDEAEELAEAARFGGGDGADE